MEPTKNIPPAFIVEACSVLSTDIKRDQTVFTPDILRRARLGEATEQDMRQIVKFISLGSNIDEKRLMLQLRQHPSVVTFLAMCWVAIRQSGWNSLSNTRINDMSYISFPHIRFGVPRINVSSFYSPPACQGLLPNSSIQTEVLAMQYRNIIQLLNKYRQLDLSRVNIMKEIMNLVHKIYRKDSSSTEEIGQKGGKTVANPYSIGISGINRLIENLWTSVELVNPSPNLKGKSVKSAKSCRNLSTGSGIETLRVEYDAFKEACSSAESCTVSEASFLKWAAGAVPAGQSYLVHNTTNPAAIPSSPLEATASRPSTANNGNPTRPPPSSTEQLKDDTVPPSPYIRAPSVEENLLGSMVSNSASMMGELEECMLELMDNGSITYEDLYHISLGVDASLASAGLSMEEIDLFCSEHDNQVDCVNLFDSLESDSYGILANDNNDLLYRQLQQQYVVPIVSSKVELNNLRQLHGHTMRRTAKACAKYSPFEIVWRKENAPSTQNEA